MSPRLIHLLTVFCKLDAPMTDQDVTDGFNALCAIDPTGRATTPRYRARNPSDPHF